MRFHAGLAVLALCALLAAPSQAASRGLPEPVIPECLGVNIHFVGDNKEEVRMIAEAGFRLIRMDLFWHRIETEKGKYDFSGHDGLMAALERHGIRPIFIVGYGNPLYSGEKDERVGPAGDDYRKAYVNFARAAARRYRGKGVLWEIWNEPNYGFWQPYSPENYVKAAREAVAAIREEDPSATILGPALAYSGHPFLDEIVKLGALEIFDVLSVHPYRGAEMCPETAMPDFGNLRGMLDACAPAGKYVPVVSGEWGYHTLYITEETQAQYLVRMFLVNTLCGAGLSIWYDWRDDGTDPNQGEHHFGVVGYDLKPKPAYKAMQVLTKQLSGYRIVRRLALKDQSDFVLVLSNGSSHKLAAWTIGDPHTIGLKIEAPAVTITGMLGARKKGAVADGSLNLDLSKSPCYVDCPYDGDALDLR